MRLLPARIVSTYAAPTMFAIFLLCFLLRAVYPGTIAMTDFRRGLRPRVLTHYLGDRCAIHVISCSDENEVIGTGRLANAAILTAVRTFVALGPLQVAASWWEYKLNQTRLD